MTNKQLSIALDYNDTYTADPKLWNGFVRTAKKLGHSVTFVTHRQQWNKDDIEKDAARLGIEVVFTSGRQKATCFNADIWIDDLPVLIPPKIELQEMVAGCEVLGE